MNNPLGDEIWVINTDNSIEKIADNASHPFWTTRSVASTKPVKEEKSTQLAHPSTSDPHSDKNVTPDEFGRDLFAILKNENYEDLKKYLWHEQDWALVAELGQPATKEQQDQMTKQALNKLLEGVTYYHERYFSIGGASVEYVEFIPRNPRSISPHYTSYNDSHLVIKVNGLINALEIDHIQVIDGVWHVSEIK